jgi:hypothetical protein
VTVLKNNLKYLLVSLVVVQGFIATGRANAQATSVTVSNATELQSAVAAANTAGGNRTILLQDGTYTMSDTIYVNAPNITLSGKSGIRERVIVEGDAMSDTAHVKNLIRAAAPGFQISNLTLQKSGWHLLQIVGEADADNAVVRNVVFRDAYEQMLKVSIDQANYSITGDNGLIENSLFEYTAGVGPQYYIGGIDIHGGKNWIVRKNTFRSIISPSQTAAEFAIHFWNQSADALVEKNIIVNCDRAIGFGLDGRGNNRGIIRNNMIFHSAANGNFADVSIYLDQSPETQVYNNTIYTENAYSRSIEYRFPETAKVFIVNNLTNKPIMARDGATGTVDSNVESAAKSWFRDPTTGDLRLLVGNTNVVDKGRVVAGLTDDFDGDARPLGGGPDVGADEWTAGTMPPPVPPSNLRVLP